MHAFGKTHRLLKKIDYDHVFNDAKKIVTDHFVFLYRINTLNHPRLGLALSKKKIAKAHDRNRLKRLVRESFRLSNTLPAVDLIVMAKSGVHKAQNVLVAAHLGKAWLSLIAS